MIVVSFVLPDNDLLPDEAVLDIIGRQFGGATHSIIAGTWVDGDGNLQKEFGARISVGVELGQLGDLIEQLERIRKEAGQTALFVQVEAGAEMITEGSVNVGIGN